MVLNGVGHLNALARQLTIQPHVTPFPFTFASRVADDRPHISP